MRRPVQDLPLVGAGNEQQRPAGGQQHGHPCRQRLPGHLIGAAPIRGITGNALGSQVDGPSRRVRFRRRLVEPEVPVGAEAEDG